MIREYLQRAKATVERITGGEVWFWIHDDREARKPWLAWRVSLTLHPHNFGVREVALRASFNAWTNLWGWHPFALGEEGVHTSLAFGPYFSLALESFDLVQWIRKQAGLDKYGNGRDTSIRFFDKAVWWEFWHDDNGWSSKTPRWRHGCWHPLDTFFGRSVHASELVETANVVIPMPEKGYRAVIELRRDTWKRPRSPFTQTIMRAHTEMKDPIPIPGKGENSWDCGQDALHGSTAPAENVIAGIVDVMKSVLDSRRRHGDRAHYGLEWRPEEAAAQ